MFVVGRRAPIRCAYCHESLRAGVSCTSCRAAFHAECRSELRRCPTLGCADGGLTWLDVPEHPAPALLETFVASSRREAIASGFVLLLVCFLATSLFTAIALSDSVTKRGERRPPNPPLAGLWIGLGMSCAIGSVLVQRAFARNVDRLLRTTKPRAATLRVTSEQQPAKGGSVTVFLGDVREAGVRRFKLSLGQTPPGWLKGRIFESSIAIYGGGMGEPLILFDGANLHAVRNMNLSRSSA